MVKKEIEKLINKSLKELKIEAFDFLVEVPAEKSNGDYSTNIAMILAKQVKKSPIEIAKDIKDNIKSNIFKKIEVAGPGFINFYLSDRYLQKQVVEILKKKQEFGKLNIGKNKKINVEFISANPTGSLTLGNGRGGFGGDVLANVLKKAGYDAIKEYYINDRGKQIKDLKQGVYKKEKRTAYQIQRENKKIIEKKLKIKFDVWFSEKSLYKNKETDKVLSYLEKNNLVYEKEDALWLKTSQFGDDKDRVLIRKNKEETYFFSDIAYLKNKFDRGFKKAIIFVGADHHGYINRMKAAAQALGYKKEQVEFIVTQMVQLREKGKNIKMSKRAGVFVELEEVVDEVGLDAARFFFLARAANSHLLFDLELAKKKSQENPVYYVQYAYARICSIFSKSKIKNLKPEIKKLKLLNCEKELSLIKQLFRYEEVIEAISNDYQVQRLPQYSMELAESFHRFYQECQVIVEDKDLSEARISLLLAVKIVLKDVLDLMGIAALKKM